MSESSDLRGPALRLLGLLLALWVLVPGGIRPMGGHLIDNVNLIFHEAGHMILMFAGETIMLLGGSFFQLLIPAVCIGAFLQRRDRFAAGICMLWLGEALAGVGAYTNRQKSGFIEGWFLSKRTGPIQVPFCPRTRITENANRGDAGGAFSALLKVQPEL